MRPLCLQVCLLAFSLGFGQVNPNLGANLNGIGVSTMNRAFVDAMKEAGGFVSLRDGNPPANTDVNGWPTEDCWVQVQWMWDGAGHSFNGTYKLSFIGKADVWTWGYATVLNKKYSATLNKTTADVVANFPEDTPDYTFFTLVFQNTSGGVRNIKLIRPGYMAATTQVFTDSFKQHVARFPVLRFMDWLHSNDNVNEVEWTDRTPVNWASYGTRYGVPWEVCIQLCNELHRDAWINVPIAASNAYVTKLANLFKSKLEPDRKLYIELSNEVWNGSFPQYVVNRNAAVAEVGAGGSNLAYFGETGTDFEQHCWALRRYARRLMEIKKLFCNVYGESAFGTTIRPVFSNQVAWTETFKQGLEYINRNYGAPSKFYYALAGAPYFGATETSSSMTAEQILDGMQACVDSYKDPYATPELHRMVGMGVWYGLHVFAYEGGPDTFGPNNIAAKKAASLDPRMRTICNQYLADWYGYGGEQFMWFVAGAGTYDSAYGTWALTNDPDNQQTPKILAMDDTLGVVKPPVTAGLLLPATQDARNFIGADRDWQTNDPYLRNLWSGQTVDYLVRSKGGGWFSAKLQASSPYSSQKIEMWLNNVRLAIVTVPNTGGWETFKPTIGVVLPIRDGLNVLRLVSLSNNGLNVKSIGIKAVPPPPTNLVATTGVGQISLTWTAPAGTGLTYKVYRRTPGYASKLIGNGVPDTNYVDQNVTSSHLYYYQVSAISLGGEGPKSAAAWAIGP